MNGYIKRSDVLEAFHNSKPSGFENSVAGMVAIKTVKEIPDADVELVKHGHWIWNEQDEVHTCSSCGMRFDYNKTYELFDHGFQYANYCPVCGAKMDVYTVQRWSW